jgi:hemoglobin
MLFDEVGGMPFIEKLVDDFYEIMSNDPEAKDCLATHVGRDMKESAVKLKFFLSGWLGGPQLYLEKFGHPRLRMRHNPFSIGPSEAEQWLYCMRQALLKSTISDSLRVQLFDSFIQVAKMLVNRPS